MIRHQQTGYLAPQADADALAKGLHWMLGHADHSMRQEARLFVLQNYQEQVVARRYEALYAELLQTVEATDYSKTNVPNLG